MPARALYLVLGLAASPCAAQTAMPPGTGEIVVLGTREPAGLPPERSLSNESLTAYGAATIGELIDEVAAENGDRAAGIVILIDGQRVPGLGDIETYPPEAVERIEILPSASNAAAGAPLGQRVYNVVLRPETTVLTARARGRVATDGGAEGGTAEFSATRIRRPQRLSASLQARSEAELLESERGVIQPAGSPASLGQFRTLRPSSTGIELSLSGADELLPGLGGLVTLKAGGGESDSALGLSSVAAPITRSSRFRSVGLNFQLSAERGLWLITLDGGHRQFRRESSTQAGEAPPSPPQQTILRMRSSYADLLALGPLLQLPAGPLHLTLGAGLRRDTVRSRAADGSERGFAQTFRELRGGIDVPIASRGGALSALGDLALAAQFIRADYGATDALANTTFAVRWSPAAWLRFDGLIGRDRTAPGVELLGEPVIETAGLRYFDPLRAETVDIVAITGGRLDLLPQRQVTRQATLTLRPAQSLDLQVVGEYRSTRTENLISALPPASDLVLQLFPERFQRDAGGRLVRVDLRPVIFPSQSEEQLRLSLNLDLPLATQRPGQRLQLAISHRYLLESRLELPGGQGTVNLLERSAIALGGALLPRHQLDLTVGYAERGLGLRLQAEHRSRSFLGLGPGAPEVLTFAPLTTIGLRGFVEGSRLFPASALRNSRIGLSIANLTNQREQVRDGLGATPLAYQGALRDPVGRTVELEFRMTF